MVNMSIKGRALWVRIKTVLFQINHEDVGILWIHVYAHGCATDWQIYVNARSKVVQNYTHGGKVCYFGIIKIIFLIA